MRMRYGMMGALMASAAAVGIMPTAAERQRGRLMRAPDHVAWPAWRYGPKGESQVFDSEAEVPAGWQDHPSKVIAPEDTGSKPKAPKVDEIPPGRRGAAPVATPTPPPPPPNPATTDVSNDLDSDGHAWDGELHAATRTKTNDGKWRMKVGKSRPDPKPGFPKPPLDL